MTITDRATSKRYHVPDGDVLFPMGRPQRPDWRMRCELWVFLLRSESRVFVAGGEFVFDGLAREADDVEIEALAERFTSTSYDGYMPCVRHPAAARLRDNPTLQRTGRVSRSS